METDLVLEGGGVKGIGLVGAVRGLREAGFVPQRIAGTSAGAIVGSLVAAGLDDASLEEVVSGLDWQSFLDRSLLDRLPFGRGLSLILERGIYEGDVLRETVADLLAEQGVHTFGDLAFDDPEGALGARRSYRLVCIVADVSRSRLVRLPWDYVEYGLDPDRQRVADAVRTSASVPFVFEPVTLRSSPLGRSSTLVDGGVLSNFPVDTFDRDDGREPRWPTIGVKLSSRADARTREREIRSTLDLLVGVVDAMLEAHDAMHLEDPRTLARTIFVDTSEAGVLEFDLSREKAAHLYTEGLAAAREWASGFSFERYLEQMRT
jgi:NTE family protein